MPNNVNVNGGILGKIEPDVDSSSIPSVIKQMNSPDVLNTSVPITEGVADAVGKGTQDMGRGSYLFEDKSLYDNTCGIDMGVEIDGFLFFPDEVQGNNTYSHREYTRTKIMSGGEFVTRGQYQAREFNFTTTLTLDPKEPYMYDKVFQIMENKQCEIISPFLGDNFMAEVSINKTHPKAAPSSLALDINIKEIVDPKTTLVGDTTITYPPSTELSEHAIEVTEKTPEQGLTPEEEELKQITYGWKVKDNNGQVYELPEEYK